MKKFIDQAAEIIYQAHGIHCADVLVLFPNQRMCTYFRYALQQVADKPLLLPNIQTLQNWMLEQSTATEPDRLQLIVTLYNTYRQTGGDLSLDEFAAVGEVMLNDFDELDTEMADPRVFFKNLEMLQSMKTYEPGEQPDEYKLKYRRFWEQFALLYNGLRQTLSTNNRAYRGMNLRSVAEKMIANQLPLPAEKQVYLIGFSGLNRCDETAFKWLKQHTTCRVICDTDPYYLADLQQEAGLAFRKHRSALGIKESSESVSLIATQPKSIHAIGVAKVTGQVKVAADILQNKLNVTAANATDTVVILPDEKLLSPLLANLPQAITSLNITMGLSLSNSLSASWLEALFRLWQNSSTYSRTGEARFYYKDVFELLQHPLTALCYPVQGTMNFIRQMKERNRIVISHSDITQALGEIYAEVLLTTADTPLFTAQLTAAVQKLLQQLIAATRSGNRAYLAEVEVLHRIQTHLYTIQKTIGEDLSINVKTLIALLRENMHSQRVPLEGDPIQGLQIMGLYETRGIDFKNVIILSANEGILPAGKSTNSYMPFEIRREFLTTHYDRDATTAYLFYRLLQRAQQVYLLYNTEPDELGGGERSRFILQLQHELSAKNPHIHITDTLYAVDPPADVADAGITVPKTPEVMEKLSGILTTSGLSPSALNTFINCSLQYYFRYIAGLREEAEPEEDFETATIGSAVHHALEKIYQPYIGLQVVADELQQIVDDPQRIPQLVSEYLNSRFDKESYTTGKNFLLYKVCIKLVKEFLKAQVQLLKQTRVSILSLEQKLEAALSVAGKEVKLSGRIDRIEQQDDIICIADYKTTGYKKLKPLTHEVWEQLPHLPDYARHVQLLMYAWLFTKNNPGHTLPLRSGIYWLKTENRDIESLPTATGQHTLPAETIQHFEDTLRSILARLLDTQQPFTQTDDHKRCRYCEFAGICRRD